MSTSDRDKESGKARICPRGKRRLVVSWNWHHSVFGPDKRVICMTERDIYCSPAPNWPLGEHTRLYYTEQQCRDWAAEQIEILFVLKNLSQRVFRDMLPCVSLSVSRSDNQFSREKSGKMLDSVTLLIWEPGTGSQLFLAACSRRDGRDWLKWFGGKRSEQPTIRKEGMGSFSKQQSRLVGWLENGHSASRICFICRLRRALWEASGAPDLEKMLPPFFSGSFSGLDCLQ